MSTEQLARPAHQASLDQAEALLHALRRGEVDAIISETEVLLLRVQQSEAELERRRQETALLADIAQQLSASLDLDTVLQRVVTGAQELCGSARVVLALRDPATDILVGRHAVDAPQGASADFRLAPGHGLGGQVLLTERPWRTADYAADPRFAQPPLARARAGGHRAVLAVPILMGARVEGLLYASNPATHPFTDHDEAILVRLAAHAAIAIQNAQLYQQAQQELAERQTAEAALARLATELEQRVVERTAALEQALAERQRVEHLALLGRLAAGVSHELRNPLAAIFLHADVIDEEVRQPSAESPAVLADAVAEIKVQLARVDDLVQDYLSLARVSSSAPIPQPLGPALTDWIAEWQPTAQAQGVTLQLAGVAALGTVAFHPSTLRRALWNLVQNALDAMPQGGRLTVTGQRRATHVQLHVQDTGSGIPPAQLAQIFEPLYTTKPQGTGLGLYLVQEIIAAHGGQLTVQSVEGQGSTFTITLPVLARAETP